MNLDLSKVTLLDPVGEEYIDPLKRITLSKISTLNQCQRRYYLTFHKRLRAKAKEHSLEVGKVFHKVMEKHLIENEAEALRALDKASLPSRDHDLILNLYSTAGEWIDQISPEFRFVETEELTSIILPWEIGNKVGWVWTIKSDFTLINRKTGDEWKGDWKTASGHGSQTAAFYHNSPQTWTYLLILQRRLQQLKGAVFAVVTKTKEPRVHPEWVFMDTMSLKQAIQFIEDSATLLDQVESTGIYPRQGTACITARGGTCPYKPLCWFWDPIEDLPINTTYAYLQEVKQNYEEFDPEAHLFRDREED